MAWISLIFAGIFEMFGVASINRFNNFICQIKLDKISLLT